MTIADESAFLGLVTESRDRRCREVLDAATADARATLRAARHEAGQRVRRAIETNRSRQHADLAAVRAELMTRLRLVVQRTEAGWLALAWPRLLSELDARWTQPETRQRWIAAVVARAESALEPSAPWRIEHPVSWASDELSTTMTPPRRADFVPIPEIRAGIRIIAHGATLDGTVAGLLGRSELVQGRLLSALERGRT